MSSFSDILDFDKFALSGVWEGLKDNPWRALVGSVDPASTAMWNGILGKDEEPLLNQMGGPMGSGKLGLGSGGVFDDFAAQGGDPEAGNQAHNIAEMVAMSSVMNNAGGGKGGTSGGEGGSIWQDPNTYMDLAQNMPQGNFGSAPMTAARPGETPEEKLARQHRDVLLAQALRLQQGARSV